MDLVQRTAAYELGRFHAVQRRGEPRLAAVEAALGQLWDGNMGSELIEAHIVALDAYWAQRRRNTPAATLADVWPDDPRR